MLAYSFLYVPKACENKKCKLHIYFHGCGESAADLGTYVPRKTALLEYASSNEMVVLFPQAYMLTGDVNTNHCWMSMIQSNADHPQYYAVRSITQGLYGKDVFSGEQLTLLEA